MISSTGGNPTCDVRSTGECEQPGFRSPVHFSCDIGCREGPVGTALDESAGGHARPGQKVGVVFDNGGDHDIVETQAQAIGEVVDGLGRVSADDGDVVATFASSEREYCLTCALVCIGRELRLVP